MKSNRTKYVTLKDVASSADVSYQTVSRVINDHPSVAETTRERVRSAIEELGYRPNRMAQGLVTKRSNTVGIVAFGSTFYGPAQMIGNIDRSLKERGYGLTMTTIAEMSFAKLREAVYELQSRAVDGLVFVTPIHDTDVEQVRELCDETPFVMLYAAPDASAPTIVIDQYEGGRLAAQHLVDLGHKHIAEISGPLTWNDARLRHLSFESTLRGAGIEPGPSVQSDWTPSGGYRAVTELLRKDAPFTALVVGNDQMALGALHGLREHGLSVPDDVSVIGFDDVPESAFFSPPLTTVRQDFMSLGQQSAEYLIALMEALDTDVQHKTLAPQLIVRESTRQHHE
jgi:LacI family transcriptional regulator